MEQELILRIQKLIKTNKIEEAENWLKQQIWYSTAADMEHTE
jgi:hypothetical protein